MTELSGARWANTALIMFAEKSYASSTAILSSDPGGAAR
jgi:hypothetical protein